MSALTDYVDSLPDKYVEGIHLLNKHFSTAGTPPWQSRIDIENLHMYDGDRCVLGQLFPSTSAQKNGYEIGVEVLKLRNGRVHAFDGNASSEKWKKYLTLWNEENNKAMDVVYNVDKEVFRVVARTSKNMILTAGTSDGYEFMVALDDPAFTTEKLPENIYRLSDTVYRYSRSDASILVELTFDPDFADVKIVSLSAGSPIYLRPEVIEFISAKMKKE